MASSILWHSNDDTASLIDIPGSIAAAQGHKQQLCSDHLLSCTPIEVPYKTNEPKSERARVRLADNTVDEALHAEYDTHLRNAVRSTRSNYYGNWCLPRPFVVDGVPTKKRKLDQSCEVEAGDEYLPSDLLFRLATQTLDVQVYADELMTDGRENFSSSISRTKSTLCCSTPATSRMQTNLNGQQYDFHLPPNSTFFLSNCSQVEAFHTAVRQQAQDQETARHFDFVLLDPPWPNRSVKRTHRTPGSTYSTVATLDDVYDLLINMDLDRLMADDCLVGVWITNKPAVRDLILGENGIFAQWGVELVQEWVWLKTTVHGEPVTPLDSVWRKPYEVLLLGRKRRREYSAFLDEATEPPAPRRRVLISVPDLHSRKPCVKSLIEPMMPDQENYRALEVFSRHLVAGWWSWGNECIKFNWSGYWHRSQDVRLGRDYEKEVSTGEL